MRALIIAWLRMSMGRPSPERPLSKSPCSERTSGPGLATFRFQALLEYIVLILMHVVILLTNYWFGSIYLFYPGFITKMELFFFKKPSYVFSLRLIQSSIRRTKWGMSTREQNIERNYYQSFRNTNWIWSARELALQFIHLSFSNKQEMGKHHRFGFDLIFVRNRAIIKAIDVSAYYR